jgi:hypothetical protein
VDLVEAQLLGDTVNQDDLTIEASGTVVPPPEPDDEPDGPADDEEE